RLRAFHRGGLDHSASSSRRSGTSTYCLYRLNSLRPAPLRWRYPAGNAGNCEIAPNNGEGMATVQELLQELEQESPATRRVLARVPAEKFDWRPHERSMSMGQLANHLASLPRGIVFATLQQSFDPGSLPPTPAPESTEALLETFDTGMEYA